MGEKKKTNKCPTLVLGQRGIQAPLLYAASGLEFVEQSDGNMLLVGKSWILLGGVIAVRCITSLPKCLRLHIARMVDALGSLLRYGP